MQLSKKQISQLIKIIETTQRIIADAKNGKSAPKTAAVKNGSTRTRRTGKDLAAFKKMIFAERKAGVSVADLAEKHGVTPSYLYQMR